MLRKAILLLSFLVSVAAGLPVSGQSDVPAITIAAQETPDLMKQGADLPYNRLMDLLFDGSPAPYTVTIYPGQRGIMQWVRRESNCMFGNITLPGQQRIPHSVLTEEEFSELVFAGPFNEVSVHMFGLHDAPPTDAVEIGRRTVGADMIAHTDVNLYAPALRRLRYARVSSTLEAFRLLEQGRVAMVMAYGVDAAHALSELKIATEVRYDADQPILEFEENLACWRGPETEAFIAHVRKRIDETRNSGALARHLPTIPGAIP